MNATLTNIRNRRSCRAFTQEQISAEELDAILEAGLYAPSGMNKQSPIMIAIQDPSVIAELSTINAQTWRKKDGDPFFGAPTVIAVLANPELCHTYQLDAMSSVTNMLIAAESLGLGACCISRGKETFESPYAQELLQKLGIDPAYVGVEHVILGHKANSSSNELPRRDGRVFKLTN